MEATQLNHWRDLLEARKNNIFASESVLRHHAFSELSARETGEISDTRLHPADLATNTQEIEKLDVLSERNIKTVKEIEDALDRLDRGTYGICQNCGQNIRAERLELIPEARYCIDCEEEVEMMELQRDPEQASIRDADLISSAEVFGEVPVSDVMKRDPVTVRPDEDVDTAATILSENNFRHLPVVDSAGNIQGVISDRDLLKVVMKIRPWKISERADNAWAKKRVSQFMSRDPETISPDATLRDAAIALLELNVNCLPVVEGTKLVGIITSSDFVKLVGET